MPKAGDEDVEVKTGASLGGAVVEDRLATAERMAADRDAVAQVSVVPGWPADPRGQHQDNRLVSCARSTPLVPRTCP